MKITVKAHLRRLADGVVRIHELDWTDTHEKWAKERVEQTIADTLHSIEFWWNDGNGSCDCNKRIRFHDVAGEEEEREAAFDLSLNRNCTVDQFRLDRLVAHVDTAGIVEEFELSTEPL